jgi:pimeloyl-ACP methyl ester carboxylesterase
MLDALSQSKTFAGLTEAALIFNLKQVRRYMTELETRAAIQARVAESLPAGTRVVIAHSLGTVVAYEAICKHPEWKIEGFITCGSPLGIRNLIFDRLEPAPEGLGVWPGGVQWWVNVADQGDVVAVEKYLKNRFGSKVEDWIVSNGLTEVHGAEKYLAQTATTAPLRRVGCKA